MIDITKLIGKYVYLSDPQLVSESEVYQRPIKIETINPAENIAGVIINNKHVISYNWILKLMELI